MKSGEKTPDFFLREMRTKNSVWLNKGKIIPKSAANILTLFSDKLKFRIRLINFDSEWTS